MGINPMDLLSLRGDLQGFDERHPKLKMFLADAGKRLDAGSVLEVSVTDINGQKIRTNIRVTDEDKQMLSKLLGLISSSK